MAQIPDLTDSELWVLRTALRERYGEDKEVQLADAEIRLSPSDRELTPCPVLYWQAQGCHFAVFKTGERRYRCQFFYRVHQQYGTGVSEYDDLTECVVSLLQVQADQAAQERGDLAGRRGKN